jgi:hypothetical protein
MTYTFQWPYRTSGAYSNIHAQLAIFKERLDSLDVQTVTDAQILVSLVDESIQTLQTLCQFLFDLVQLKDEDFAEFQLQLLEDFRLGPHGLRPVIQYLFQTHTSIIDLFRKGLISSLLVSQCIDKLNIIAVPSLTLLLAFRRVIPRGSFDPEGIAEFQEGLKKKRQYFGVCFFPCIFIDVTHSFFCRLWNQRINSVF